MLQLGVTVLEERLVPVEGGLLWWSEEGGGGGGGGAGRRSVVC